MSNFNVLTLGEFIHKEGIDIALESFAELFQDVTSKHQRKMKLIIVTKGTLSNYIQEKTKVLGINNVIEIVPWSEQETIEEWYQEASVMLLPSKDNISRLISEAFSFGLPVICYEREDLEDTVDRSCGMTIEYETFQQNIFNFSDVLRMLYFDPEARKILKKGALKKYETQFSWGFSNAATG